MARAARQVLTAWFVPIVQDIANRQASAAGGMPTSSPTSQPRSHTNVLQSPTHLPAAHRLQTSPSPSPPQSQRMGGTPPRGSQLTHVPGVGPPMTSPFQTPHPCRAGTHQVPMGSASMGSAGRSPGMGTQAHQNLINMTQAANSKGASTSQQPHQGGIDSPLPLRDAPNPPTSSGFSLPSQSRLAGATPAAATTPGLPRWMLPAATPAPQSKPSQVPGTRLGLASEPGSRPPSQTRFSTQV